MSANKKIEEAEEHVRQAEKSLKTGLFKWKPEYEIACDEYQQAATCYKNAKCPDKCKECLLKAVECYKETRSLFHAARCLEQVILLLKEEGNYQELHAVACRAGKLYQTQNNNEAAISAMDKAARMLENQMPDKAIELYLHCIDIAMGEDSVRQAAEYASRMARMLVRLKMYDQAADAIRREICIYQKTESYQSIGRLAVVLVLIQLARGDSVAAEKAFKEWGNCCDPNEVQTLEMLIQAYDDDDPDLAKRALASAFIRHMDVEYACLARDLPLPQGVTAQPKANVIENAAASYKSPNLTTTDSSGTQATDGPSSSFLNDDDIEEGGLC